jgi:hypothetical protein
MYQQVDNPSHVRGHLSSATVKVVLSSPLQPRSSKRSLSRANPVRSRAWSVGSNAIGYRMTSSIRWCGTGELPFGIIIAVRRLAHGIVRRLFLILNQVTADEMVDMLRYF